MKFAEIVGNWVEKRGKWAYFEGKEEEESLHWVETAVHKVAHEEVVGLGAISAYFKEFHQVVKLAVNISANLSGITKSDYRDGWADLLDVGFLHEDFARLIAQVFDLWLLDALASLQQFDLLVEWLCCHFWFQIIIFN